MIALLNGSVEGVGAEAAVITVSGIGFEVHMPSSDLSRLHAGQGVTVHTHLDANQEGVSLYGFLDRRARDLFLRLRKVPGVGPKAALSLLSTLPVDDLLTAINRQDVKSLTRAKGVGRRGAQKIILELAGKIADITESQPTRALPENEGKVVDGLESLGWRADQARAAVEGVMGQSGLTRDIPDDKIAAVLRKSLEALGRVMK